MDDTLIEDFINEVRSHEMLYDKANKNYTKNNLKNKKWIDIGKQFAITGKILYRIKYKQYFSMFIFHSKIRG